MNDIIKTLESLATELKNAKLAQIERDIILDRLKSIYAQLLDAPLAPTAVFEQEQEKEQAPMQEQSATETTSQEQSAAEPIKQAEKPAEQEEAVPDEVSVFEENPAAQDESFAPEPVVFEEEPSAQPTVKAAAEPEPEPESEQEQEPSAPSEEEVSAPKHKLGHTAILSLYDDADDEPAPAHESNAASAKADDGEFYTFDATFESTEETASDAADEPQTESADDAPVVEFEFEAEEPAQNGEADASVEEPNATSPAVTPEQTAEPKRVATPAPAPAAAAPKAAIDSVTSLRDAIGLNDKFLLMRDLFSSNADLYESAITTLDSFDAIDDAMLYIHDNYHWNANSEGAKLIADLLIRKLL